MNPYGTPVPGAIEFLPGEHLDAKDIRPGRLFINEESEGKAHAPWDFPLQMIGAWETEMGSTDHLLRTDGIYAREEQHIDEIALLLPNEEYAHRFVMDATLIDGVSHFNASWDRVRTNPIQHEYRVRYDFLQLEGKDYRIEAMHFPWDQTSPLHAPIAANAQRYDAVMPVHLSFKCQDSGEYDMTLERLVDHPDYTLAMECRSTYGRFSYWRNEGSDLYIKPRVNMRDAK